MQASISALPPPDQWNDHVLAHLTSMSADHHRGLIQDIHHKIRAFLPLAMQSGWQHPSHMQLQNVSAGGVAPCGLLCLRRCPHSDTFMADLPAAPDAVSGHANVPPSCQPMGRGGESQLQP